jgi:hypothetical protein
LTGFSLKPAYRNLFLRISFVFMPVRAGLTRSLPARTCSSGRAMISVLLNAK